MPAAECQQNDLQRFYSGLARKKAAAAETACADETARPPKPRFSHCNKLDCADAVGYKTGTKQRDSGTPIRPHEAPAYASQRGGPHANEIDAAGDRTSPRTILAANRYGAQPLVRWPSQLSAAGDGDCGWRRRSGRRCLRACRAARDSREQQGHGQAHPLRRLRRAVEVRGACSPPPQRRAQESAEFLRLEHDAAAGPVRHRHAERLDLRAPSQRHAGHRSRQAQARDPRHGEPAARIHDERPDALPVGVEVLFHGVLGQRPDRLVEGGVDDGPADARPSCRARSGRAFRFRGC